MKAWRVITRFAEDGFCCAETAGQARGIAYLAALDDNFHGLLFVDIRVRRAPRYDGVPLGRRVVGRQYAESLLSGQGGAPCRD